MSFSFVLNDVDFGGPNYGLVIVRYDDPWIPEMRVNLQRYGQRDGAVSQGRSVGPRIWEMECVIFADNEGDFKTRRENVIDALVAAHTAGETEFILGFRPEVKYMARPYNLNGVTARIRKIGALFPVSIIAPDPTPEPVETEGSG